MLWAGVFFFSPSILWFSHTGDHPDDELANLATGQRGKQKKRILNYTPYLGLDHTSYLGLDESLSHPTESVNILYVPPIKFKHEKLDNIK